MVDLQLGDRTKGPVYAQVRDQIATQIRSKQIASGDSLPSPALLAQRLAVDKGEIQRAYFELERSGLVKKRSKKDFLGKDQTLYLVN